MKHPCVLVVTRRTVRKHKYIDYVGEFHLALLIRGGILPIMVPVSNGTLRCLPDYMALMNGLLLVEGEDIEPKNYKAGPENTEHLRENAPTKGRHRDSPRSARASRKKLPILGICRGSQLLNAMSGGTPVRRRPKRKTIFTRSTIDFFEHYDTYRHPISIVPGSPLHKWYPQSELQVNSYHHQGVRDLASRFKPMAHSEDGLVEAFYDPKADFVVGLSSSIPERMMEEPEGNWRIWKAFGAAVKRAAKS